MYPIFVGIAIFSFIYLATVRKAGSLQHLLFFFLINAPANCFSQKLLFLPLIKIETKDGLSSPNVRKIIQDKYGFMWFATQDGLNRFDGNKVVLYNSVATDPRHVILGSDVFDIGLEQNGNYLWCLTAYGGLSKIDILTGLVTSRYSILLDPEKKIKLWFKCMSIKSQSILIGTDEGYLIKFTLVDNKSEIVFSVKQSDAKHFPIDKIFCDSDAYTWLMASDNGIVVFDDSLKIRVKYYSARDLGFKLKESFKFTGFETIEKTLIVSSSDGLVQIDLKNKLVIDKNNCPLKIPSSIANNSFYCISKKGDTILTSCNSGLYLIDRKTTEIKKILFSKVYDDNSWLTLTSCVFQSGPNIWIGSQYGVGWINNNSTAFTGFFNSMNGSGVKIEHGITLCKANDSTLITCADDGLYFTNYFTGVIAKFKEIDFYYHAFKGPLNYIFASGLNNGIRLIDNTFKTVPLTKIFPELSVLKEDVLISSQQFNDSVYFLASQNQKGIYIWNWIKKKVRILNTNSRPVKLTSNVINRLFVDSKKKLWIIGDNSVSVYDYTTDGIEHLNLFNPANNQPLSINMDICEANGKFWIAAYGTGIVALDRNKKISKIISINEGLNNLGLYKIFRLNDSMIITSSNNGLFVLNVKTNNMVSYFEEDGIQSNNFEEASGCEDENFVFLGGLKGFSRIDKKLFKINRIFYQLFFSSIRINQASKIIDTSNLFLKTIDIPNNSTQVLITFSYLDYTNAKRKLFRYRLLELNEKWDVLNTTDLSLVGTPPGRYSLQVEAANDDGGWSNPIQLSLHFLPKWYQTWWFKLIVTLTTAFIIYKFYDYRIQQLNKQHEIRKSIATDLHDDLGSTLNSVKIFTNLAINGVDQQESLQQIKHNLSEASIGLRDMIWVLDDSLDTVDELVTRLNQYALPVAGASNIETVIKADSEANRLKLTKEEKRNLFLVCKEAINNSIKYSGASKLSVSIIAIGKKIQIEIADNGKGFNTYEVKNGYGFKNMQYRVGEIKYRAKVISSPGNGTQISIKPL